MPYDQEIKRLSSALIFDASANQIGYQAEKIKKSAEFRCINTNQEDSWPNYSTLANLETCSWLQ